MKKNRPAPGRRRPARRVYVSVFPIVVGDSGRPGSSPPIAPLILVVIDLVSWPDRVLAGVCREAGWIVSDRTADLLLKVLIVGVCAVTARLIRRRRGRGHLHPDAGAAGRARPSDES